MLHLSPQHWTIRLHNYPLLPTILHDLPLLTVRVQLDLVDAGLLQAGFPDFLEVVHAVVGNADGANLAEGAVVEERAVGFEAEGGAGVGVVDEEEVDVVCPGE
jgi:hypothetical protein